MSEELELDFFKEDNYMYEEAMGIHVNSDGSWSEGQEPDAEEVIKKFNTLELSIANLKVLIDKKDLKIVTDSSNSVITAEVSGTQSFNPDGKVPVTMMECPYCHKKVEKILSNGYCSKTCAMRAKAEKAQKKINAAGEKTLEIIAQVQSMLKLLDMALNVLTLIPEILKDIAKLPPEFRDYVIFRIEIMFLHLKKIINNIQIYKNEKIIELMKKIKFGVLDDALAVILAPVQAILQAAVALQQALNTTISSIIALLESPALGSIPPNGGHGFMLTAKSVQYSETAGKIFVINEPKINSIMPMKSMMNVIDIEKIEALIKAALPPIQEFEYFLDPTAFKVSYALSSDNAPKVKKMIQMLEEFITLCLGECFPRYKNLRLTRIFFVLAILTGWGPLTRGIFGDFIFHGTI